MNIINYINSKNKCYVFNLTKNERFVEELNLTNYPYSNNYEQSYENIFTNKDLVIFIISSSQIKDKSIFKLTSKHNNVVVYVKMIHTCRIMKLSVRIFLLVMGINTKAKLLMIKYQFSFMI